MKMGSLLSAMFRHRSVQLWNSTANRYRSMYSENRIIGSYREIAIAIESEAGDSLT